MFFFIAGIQPKTVEVDAPSRVCPKCGQHYDEDIDRCFNQGCKAMEPGERSRDSDLYRCHITDNSNIGRSVWSVCTEMDRDQ